LSITQEPAGVTITSKNFEVTIRPRRRHGLASLPLRADNGAGQRGRSARMVRTW